VERFTREERDVLAPYFTNLDGPVFALVNLPEVVKGALFARYSRSPKSLRRLFLDEFSEEAAAPVAHHIGTARADRLYERVFSEYGDDSVAQLGGVHLACEDASNILTKVLEWGRLMAYLEQSTRYIPYTDRPGGRWRYHVPAELDGHPLRERFVETHDRAFETYVRWIEPLRDHWASRLTRPADIGDAAWRSTIRAKALDSLRGLLPAATATRRCSSACAVIRSPRSVTTRTGCSSSCARSSPPSSSAWIGPIAATCGATTSPTVGATPRASRTASSPGSSPSLERR